MLDRAQILAKQDDLPTSEVAVPEWGEGETVRVRGLTSRARFDWVVARDKASVGAEDAPEPGAFLVVLSAIDADGARLFQTQDVDAVAQLRADVIERINERVFELSGLSDKAAADAEGKSEATPSGDSPSDSPETSAAP